jgi:hypothetical protein
MAPLNVLTDRPAGSDVAL